MSASDGHLLDFMYLYLNPHITDGRTEARQDVTSVREYTSTEYETL